MGDNFIKIYKWLYPISFLYGIGVCFRNKLFDRGLLSSRSFNVPIISVGNITVGGTGKTPHTEYLIKLLRQENKVAVLSRGYKRKSKGFVLGESHMSASIIGDEPYQMVHKFPEIEIAVDKNRCHGIEQLCSAQLMEKPDVIILDDAFQHRYVKPGLNILLVDFYRPIDRDALLPAGRLREPATQKHRANVIIVTKCPLDIKPAEIEALFGQLTILPHQKLYFTSFRYTELVPVFNKDHYSTINLNDLDKEIHILLMTGIASPKQMLKDLKNYTGNVETLVFSDHHDFTHKDMEELELRFNKMNGEKKIIVTTEKDAARLIENSYLCTNLKSHMYVLPIEVCFLQNGEAGFNNQILEFVREGRSHSFD